MSSKPSGAQNRKRGKLKTLADTRASAKLMSSFLLRDDNCEHSKWSDPFNDNDNTKTLVSEQKYPNNPTTTHSTENTLTPVSLVDEIQTDYLNDIGLWPNLTPQIRDQIIANGPQK